jgi:hypothetical protein
LRIARSELEGETGTYAETIFQAGGGVGKLCPQPRGLEGAHCEVTGKLKVHAATHFYSEAVRTASESSRRGKDTIETMGLSGQRLP